MKSPEVTVTILAEIAVPLKDNGYLGPDATIDDHIAEAGRKLNSYSFMVKEGSNDPKIVPVRFKIQSIVLVPGDAP